MREAALVCQSNPYRIFCVDALTLSATIFVAQIALLVAIKVDIDRILRNYRSQYGLVCLSEVARGELCAADPTIDRRAYLGEFQIQLRCCHCSLGCVDVCDALAQIRTAVLVLLA